MNLRAFQVDAFASGVFSGNPAVVVLLEESLGDDILMKIARESFVPETAFLLEDNEGYILRWFTPDIEMDLCGHATLASAHVLFTELGYPREKIVFKTKSGDLTVIRDGEMYEMDFPLREGERATLPIEIYDSLSIKPVEVFKARDYMLVYSRRSEVENIEIDRPVFDEININPGGVIITAPGEDCDFVSRYFTPQATILEDPVTGSAHCTLAPYWSKRLGKETLHAKQISSRGGVIYCTVTPERVKLKGKAVTYSESRLNI
ncbi:PhzF family phenazine biosynthesis protein [Bacteroidota bacterium]